MCHGSGGDDGAAHRLADLAEDVLRRKAELAIAGGALEERLGRLLVENAGVDGAVVQLRKGEERRERDAPVAAAERAVLQKREEKGRDFVAERRIGLAAEGRHLRALHGVEETELRLDDAGMRLVAAELGGDGAMQIDEVLNREIPDADAVSL